MQYSDQSEKEKTVYDQVMKMYNDLFIAISFPQILSGKNLAYLKDVLYNTEKRARKLLFQYKRAEISTNKILGISHFTIENMLNEEIPGFTDIQRRVLLTQRKTIINELKNLEHAIIRKNNS